MGPGIITTNNTKTDPAGGRGTDCWEESCLTLKYMSNRMDSIFHKPAFIFTQISESGCLYCQCTKGQQNFISVQPVQKPILYINLEFFY